ncbi:MAG: DUF72 domain-containing protein [Thiobacillaceae bacterium]|jgi:uncharacterized protein YecE (DUF72 family)
MAETLKYNVYFGAIGWQHIHWQARFYPDDLPEEWQLSYYNTQFRCVYLPSISWVRCSLEIAKSWLTDTQANFRFILEAPDSLNRRSTQFLEAMGERALISDADRLRPQIFWFPPEPDLRQLRGEIQKAIDQRQDLFLLNREAHLPALEKVRSLVELMGY